MSMMRGAVVETLRFVTRTPAVVAHDIGDGFVPNRSEARGEARPGMVVRPPPVAIAGFRGHDESDLLRGKGQPPVLMAGFDAIAVRRDSQRVIKRAFDPDNRLGPGRFDPWM